MPLEERYVVFKLKDIGALPALHRELIREWLHDIGSIVGQARLSAGKSPLECVVVESDWPEYKGIVSAIEQRVRQEHCEHVWQWYQVAGEGQICAKCHLRNFDCED